MKKGILYFSVMTSLLFVSHNAQSQTFSDVSPSGHTLYYWIDEYCDTCTSALLVNSPNAYGYWDTGAVNSYLNYSGNLIIPETVIHNGRTYTVHDLAMFCFENCSSLTSVTIPLTISGISWRCFRNCNGLTSVTIPSSVTYIEEYAFTGCTSLTTINYNAIDCEFEYSDYRYEKVFMGCDNVTTLNIGDDVRNIHHNSFRYFKNLTNLTIGKNVETFYWNALADTLNSLTTVNYNAKDIYINPNYYGLFDSHRITAITNITIGNAVENIPEDMFRGCHDLSTVVFNADSCRTASYSFYYCNNITSFTFGANVKYIPSHLCDGLRGLTSVTIPNSVRSIDSYAFEDCTGLQSVTIGSSVEDIYYAFHDCTGLTSITIPDATRSISWAFLGCTGLQSVTIGRSVEDMSGAFRLCSHLTSIRSRAEYPPICDEDSFDGVPAYADIIVPCGAAYRYQVTDYWRDFSRITEDCDGIEDVNMDDVRAWPEDGRIRVEGANGAPVNVFDMEGRNVRNEALPAGVYMVKVGNLPARKVVVVK